MKRWDVTVRLAKKYKLKRFAEIGVKEGKHVAEILRRVPESTVVAVDPWAKWSIQWPKRTERRFDLAVKPYGSRVTKLKMIGTEAAPLFEQESFDYVFIDDDHKFETLHSNIVAWLPKVRRGGILAGHDVNNGFSGVDRCLWETFGNDFNVEPDSVWWLRV